MLSNSNPIPFLCLLGQWRQGSAQGEHALLEI